MKYLFIDDLRNPLNYILPKKEDTIICAHSYEAAVQALSDFIFDIIMFDHDLGEEKTGYDVAKYMVENDIKIILGFKIHSANLVRHFNISQLLTHYGYKKLS